MPRKVLYSGLGAVRLAARQPKASAAGVPRLPENRTKGPHCKGHRGINAQAGNVHLREKQVAAEIAQGGRYQNASVAVNQRRMH